MTFEFPFRSQEPRQQRSPPGPEYKDCYSKKVHTDEPEVQMKIQGDRLAMRIAVVGSGYVGLVTGACFADLGHEVVLVDNDEKKLAALQERRGADS